MPFIQNLLGTSSLLFRLGAASTGLYWKNDGASRILARNSDDSAYVQVQGLNPTQPQDFVTLDYLGTAAVGGYKTACRVASTANIAALSGLLTIDGVVLVAGDRVLVKDQTTPSQNGIYVAAAGAWARASDFAAASVQSPMQAFPVSEGTVWADTVFVLTTNATITVGVTSLTFLEQGALSRLGSAQPLAARINRGALSAPIDATKLGVVSLGSQSTGGGTGVLATYGTCGGGDRNTIGTAADYSTCPGGLLNTILGTHGAVGGGQGNSISTTTTHCSIGGGQSNQISSGCTFCNIGGGQSNAINRTSAIGACVSGGITNSANANYCHVGGGLSNIAGDSLNASSTLNSVLGGQSNQALGIRDVVCGGQSNITGISGVAEARTEYAFIGNGDGNQIRRPTTGTPSTGTNAIRWSGIVSGRLIRIRRDYGFAHGEQCEVGHDNATTYGFGTHGFVHGVLGYSLMDGQYVHGSTGGSQFTSGLGGAQYSRTNIAGLSAAGAAVILRPQGSVNAANVVRLENNKSYTIRVTANAKTSAAGTNTCRYFVLTFICRVSAGGIVAIAGAVTTTSDGDAVAWTLVPTVSGLADNTITFTFTAVGPDTARCFAVVEMAELVFA